MDAKILIYDSYAGAFEAAIADIKSRQIDLDVRHILIVPDKYTLYAEKQLFSEKGAFDAEVMTFNRLAVKLNKAPSSYINRYGAIMILRKIIGEGKNLNCFKRSAAFRGFAEKVYDTIAQLQASGVKPQDLKGEGALKSKTDDLRFLYERYLQETAGSYVDSSGLMKMMPDLAHESDYFDNAHIYAVNFDRFTYLAQNALDAIQRKALSMKIYQAEINQAEPLRACMKPVVYSAPDFVEELKAAAKRIKNAVYEDGLRFKDICVVSAAADYESVKRIFDEYEIPFFLDKSYNLNSHPLVRYILGLLDCCDKRYSRKKIVRLSKNVLFNVDVFEAAEFENYCNKLRVDYNGFFKPFEEEVPEKVRRKIMSVLQPLNAFVKKFMSASEFIGMIGNLIDGVGGEVRLHEMESPYDLSAAFGKIMSVLQLMARAGGDAPQKFEVLTGTLKEGFSSIKLSLLPRINDCVTVGEPSVFRGQRFKYTLVLGFNEGVLPLSTSDCGIITDREIDALSAVGAKIEPTTEEVNDRAGGELCSLLCSAEKLFISYIENDAGLKASAMLNLMLRSCAPVRYCAAQEKDMLYFKCSPTALARQACCVSAASELFLAGLDKADKGEYAPFVSTLAYVLKDRKKDLLSGSKTDFMLSRRYDIFFKKRTAYVSQIQTFFTCPYRHFLEYGLCLKEREDGSVTPKDVGNILHRTAELFTAAGHFDSPASDAERIFDQVIEQEYSQSVDPLEGSILRLKKEAARFCEAIAAQITHSDFTVMGQEAAFDSSGKGCFKTQIRKLKSGGEVSLVGVIDRVDRCGQNARIIDYKTGSVGASPSDIFSLKKLYYGVKIQLQLYASVLQKNGLKPVGMFYFPVRLNFESDEFSSRLIGAYLSELSVADAMDAGLKEGGKSKLFNANVFVNAKGERTLKKSSLAFSETEMDKLCAYADKVFDSALEDIDDGFIEPLPYEDGVSSSCAFCPFKGVCAFKTEKTFRSFGGEVKSAVFGEEYEL